MRLALQARNAGNENRSVLHRIQVPHAGRVERDPGRTTTRAQERRAARKWVAAYRPGPAEDARRQQEELAREAN
jgi:hypothetical protein